MKNIKGHNFDHIEYDFTSNTILFSAYRLMMLYIRTNFHENILKLFKLQDGHNFHINLQRDTITYYITVLVFCTSFADDLYLYPFRENIFNALGRKTEKQTDIHTDRQTDRRTERQKDRQTQTDRHINTLTASQTDIFYFATAGPKILRLSFKNLPCCHAIIQQK